MHLCVEPGCWVGVGHGAAQPHGSDSVGEGVGGCGLWVCWNVVGESGWVVGAMWVFWVGWVWVYDMVATWQVGVP